LSGKSLIFVLPLRDASQAVETREGRVILE
jgi:hypothetical protein